MVAYLWHLESAVRTTAQAGGKYCIVIGGNDSGSATDVYVASVMISGDTITASGVGSHALTSTGCPGVDRIMCEIYGII